MKVKKMVSVMLAQGESIEVPKNEFWKVIVSIKGIGDGELNEIYIPYKQAHRFEFVENQSLNNGSTKNVSVYLQGLAFEL